MDKWHSLWCSSQREGNARQNPVQGKQACNNLSNDGTVRVSLREMYAVRHTHFSSQWVPVFPNVVYFFSFMDTRCAGVAMLFLFTQVST